MGEVIFCVSTGREYEYRLGDSSRLNQVSTTCGSGWVTGKEQSALTTALQAAGLQMCNREYLPRSEVALSHGEQASSLFYNMS